MDEGPMTTTETTIDTLTTVLATRWQAAANKFMDLAATLPEGKFEAELAGGARTCDAVLRHVAYWNRYVADTLNGRKADDSGNELSKKDYRDKAAVLGDLKKSSCEIASGLNRGLDDKSLQAFCMGLEHLSEHYGQ